MTKTGQQERSMFALAIGAMLVTAMMGAQVARAQTYKVVYRFKGFPTDGAEPSPGLIRDTAGNLYGTTSSGGASDWGVVFKLDKTGETVLYSFTGGADGNYPVGLIRDSAGNLYGTTSGGASGYGVVFKLDTTGTKTMLYSFTGGTDGAYPEGLIRDSAGNLYGTTYWGGASDWGAVFKLDTTGTETVLHSFRGNGDGGNPVASLIGDSAGNLYGTTHSGGKSGCGGYSCGVVFKLDATRTETVLHSFTRGTDGSNPSAGVIQDSAGNLYGTTEYGGASGAGVVFMVDTTGRETVLYSFTGRADGANPETRLIRDPAGNLFGTTYYGGIFSGPCSLYGCGVVFKLDTTGTYSVLYSFTGGADGANPVTGLVQDSEGNLHGSTYYGGIFGGACGPYGCGVVFKLQL